MICNPWGLKELDTTERIHFHFSLSCIGEGNGNPLQCSCLENHRDGGAAVSGVAQSRTQLKRLSSSSVFMSMLFFLSSHSLLPPLCPQIHSLYMCLHSFPANRFKNTIFFRFYIYALIYNIFLIYFTLYSRLYIDPPHRTDSNLLFFLWLNSIPLCVCTTSSLSSVSGRLGCFPVIAINFSF